MPQLEQYREYDRDEAMLYFGPKPNARILDDGEWVLFPNAAVCFGILGIAEHGSTLPGAKSFHWVAPRASRSAPDRYSGIPLEIRAGTKHELHLFLRIEGSAKYVYVGRLGPAHSYGFRGHGSFGEADLELQQSLPTDLWHRLTGTHVPEDPKHLDAVLGLLSQQTTTAQRLDIVTQILSYWLGAQKAPKSWPPRDLQRLRVPEAYRTWLSLVGQREEIFSQNNLMVPVTPPALGEKVADGKILIMVENQGVYHWATSPEGEDPPVWGRLNEPEVQWSHYSESVSEFLIGFTLLGMIMTAPYGGAASCVSQDVVDRIGKELPALPIHAWAWPGDGRFYGARGAFMFTCTNGESDGIRGYSVWVGSKTAEAVAFLRDIVDDAWESSAL